MSDPQPSPPFDVEPAIRSALLLMVTGVDEPSMFTEDVTGRTPFGQVNGRDDLLAQVTDWRDGLTSAELVVDGIAVDGTTAMVRWQLAARHTGVVLVNEDLLFEPTDRCVTLQVISEFAFQGERIGSFRHDYDRDDLLRQLRPEPAG
jgi:hypothetical protein